MGAEAGRMIGDGVVVVEFGPSRRGPGVARVAFPWNGEPPHDQLLRLALEAFEDGSARCPFVQRQARRGRDAFPSRDPEDYTLRAVGTGLYVMEPRA